MIMHLSKDNLCAASFTLHLSYTSLQSINLLPVWPNFKSQCIPTTKQFAQYLVKLHNIKILTQKKQNPSY